MADLQLPATRQPVVEQAPNETLQFTVPWYRFFGSLLTLAAPSGAAPVAITVGASPFSYTAPESGSVLISGGTVTLIQLGRGGVFTNTGVIAGVIPVSKGDIVRVTHAGAPTMTFVRR